MIIISIIIIIEYSYVKIVISYHSIVKGAHTLADGRVEASYLALLAQTHGGAGTGRGLGPLA